MSSPDDFAPLGGVWVGAGSPGNPPPPPRKRRAIAGVLLVAVGSGLGFFTGPPVVGPLLGLLLGVVGFAAWPAVTSATPSPPAKRPVSPPPPLHIEYTPAGPLGPIGLVMGSDEEELMTLCGNDAAQFERLVACEREAHPHLARPDLVRLARDHFRRDRG